MRTRQSPSKSHSKSRDKGVARPDLSPNLPGPPDSKWDTLTVRTSQWDDNDSTPAYVWAVVGNCRGNRCPLRDKCQYVKGVRYPLVCQSQSQYLRSIYRCAVLTAGADCPEEVMALIGLELVPLYDQLFRLKMHLHNPDQMTPMHLTANGSLRVDPAMKEMREVIKTLRQVWKEVRERSVVKQHKRTAFSGDDPAKLGDQAWIEAMYGDANADGDTDGDTDENPKRRNSHKDESAVSGKRDDDASKFGAFPGKGEANLDGNADYEEGTGIDLDAMPGSEKKSRRRATNKPKARKKDWRKTGPKPKPKKKSVPYAYASRARNKDGDE